jgi:hypothetical protein
MNTFNFSPSPHAPLPRVKGGKNAEFGDLPACIGRQIPKFGLYLPAPQGAGMGVGG